MSNWQKWIWPGIITCAILSFLAVYTKAQFIEADLGQRATAALSEKGLKWASVEMDGRDATLTGSAPSEADQQQAAETTLNAYDVRIVQNNSGLLALQSPYLLKANRSENSLELTGFVPNEGARATVKEQAKKAFPETEIKDSLALARGAPDSLLDITNFGFDQLAGLTQGEFSVSDLNFAIKGAAGTRDKFDAAIAAVNGDLPGGAKLASSEISAPIESPYNWTASYDGSSVTLGGFVPSSSVAESLNQAAKAALPDAEVVDNQLVAPGQPEGFNATTLFALEQLSRFSTGKAGLSDRDFSVEGVARDVALFEVANGAVDALPSGMNLVKADIAPPTISPYEWSAKLAGNTVTLDGFVPNTEARASVISSVKKALSGTEIKDDMRIAAGAPERFLDAARFAANQLNRFSEGSVGLSDRALAVTGKAKTPGGYTAATVALTGRLPADMTLASQNITAADVAPYTWGAEFDGAAVNLTGFVPNEETRAVINEAAKTTLPNVSVNDLMQIASGEPQGFTDATQFALQQLQRLNSGSAKLSDLNLSVRGAATDAKNYRDAKSAITGALPAGLSLSSEDIQTANVSPFDWSATLAGNEITLSGHVPDVETRQRVLADVAKSVPEATVTDNMLIAGGSFEGFENATRMAAKQLRRLKDGKVSLLDQAFSVEGTAKDPQNYTVAKAVANGVLSEGVSLANEDIKPAPVSPYIWSADSDGKTVRLTGYVPSEDSRQKIVANVRKAVPGAKVKDNMLIAAGQPDTFNRATDFLANQLSRLSSGMVSLNDLKIVAKGVANSTQNYADAEAVLEGALPAGLSLETKDISPPTIDPYSWSANYDGTTVTLGGFVPSKEVKQQLTGEAAIRLPSAKVVDQMQIAAGAPETHVEAAIAAIGVLPRFSEGSVALSGVNLTVNGTGKSSQEYLAAEDYLAGSLDGNVNLVSSNIRPPKQDGDYLWNARKSGSQIVLSGSAPSRSAITTIAEKAATSHPGMTIVNNMTIATGSADGFVEMASRNLGLLNEFEEGNASIKNQQTTIAGTAKSVAAYEKLLVATAQDPSGQFAWMDNDISPAVIAPYNWSVDNSGTEVLMGGFVPFKGVANVNVAAAQATLGKPVLDSQRVAGGAPDKFGDAVASLIGSVSKLENARASLTGTNAFLQGRTSSEAEAQRIGAEAQENLPGNYVLSNQISFPLPKIEPKPEPKPEPEPDAKPEPKEEVAEAPKDEKPAPKVCNVDFGALFQGEKIQFDTARAVIKPGSFPLLDRIAEGLRECEESKIEIGGHTDSRGGEGYNQGLSEARARAVFEYMVSKAGVSDKNLVAKGYGESSPIASNQTVAERSKNRRIEFKVID